MNLEADLKAEQDAMEAFHTQFGSEPMPSHGVLAPQYNVRLYNGGKITISFTESTEEHLAGSPGWFLQNQADKLNDLRLISFDVLFHRLKSSSGYALEFMTEADDVLSRLYVKLTQSAFFDDEIHLLNTHLGRIRNDLNDEMIEFEELRKTLLAMDTKTEEEKGLIQDIFHAHELRVHSAIILLTKVCRLVMSLKDKKNFNLLGIASIEEIPGCVDNLRSELQHTNDVCLRSQKLFHSSLEQFAPPLISIPQYTALIEIVDPKVPESRKDRCDVPFLPRGIINQVRGSLLRFGIQ